MEEPSASPEALAFGRPAHGWRRRWFIIIFESATPGGRRFDLILLAAIAASVAVVMLESVQPLADRNTELFLVLEWGFTLLFNFEYIARLVCVQRPFRYATSFFGLIDLAAGLPMYLALLAPGSHVLIDIRILRMLRAFRILKLTAYVREFSSLGQAFYASRRKVAVFLAVVALLVVVLGTLMYVVEGPANGFTSIPVAIYWAITTMTTVGFGDIAPRTSLGRVVASVVMLLGWGILAVPTGIVTAEMTTRRLSEADGPRRPCPSCGTAIHVAEAQFCHLCGAPLGSR